MVFMEPIVRILDHRTSAIFDLHQSDGPAPSRGSLRDLAWCPEPEVRALQLRTNFGIGPLAPG